MKKRTAPRAPSRQIDTIVGLLLCATCLTWSDAGRAQVTPNASRIEQLAATHRLLTHQLDDLDHSVRVRVERGLRDQVDAWRLGFDDLTGENYQKRLGQALEMAGRYGLDVQKLRRLHDLTKQALLRADLAQPGGQHADAVRGPAGRLAGFMDWAGREQEERAKAAAAAQSYRKELHRKVSVAYLEALLERDPATALARFRSYCDALRQILAADADILLAEAEVIMAELELVQTIGSGVPLLGEAMDLAALVTGTDALTGQQLDALGWGMALLGTATGPVGQAVKRLPGVAQALGQLVALASEVSAPIVAAGRYSGAQLAEFVHHFSAYPEVQATARLMQRRALNARSEVALDDFLRSAEGRAGEAAWATANAQGAAKAESLGKVIAGGKPDELIYDTTAMAAYVEARADKRAIARLKEAEPALREQVSRIEEVLYGKVVPDAAGRLMNDGTGVVDRLAIRDLKDDLAAALKLPGEAAPRADLNVAQRAARELASNLRGHAARIGLLTDDQVRELAVRTVITAEKTTAPPSLWQRMTGRKPEEVIVFRRNAVEYQRGGIKQFKLNDLVDADNLDIQVFNASNKPPKPGDIGSDRDITYQLRLKDGTLMDVPKELVEKHYNTALYTALNPGRGLPFDPATRATEAAKFAKRVDHTVTDGLALDAYRPGMKIEQFLGKGATRVDARAAADVGATIAYKGYEWLHPGKELLTADPVRGWGQVSEGMRQLTKQYDNQILGRLNARGLDPIKQVPARLGHAVEIMKRVTTPVSELPAGAKPLSPAAAEAAIRAAGFRNLEEVSVQLGEYFEALEKFAVRP